MEPRKPGALEHQMIAAADRADSAVMKIWNAYTSGNVSREAALDGSQDVVGRLAREAAAHGQAAYARQALEATRDLVDDLYSSEVLEYTDQSQQIDRAWSTLRTFDDAAVTARLGEIAGNMIVQAFQAGHDAAMRSDTRAKGWTRDLNVGACKLCQWWSREGRVWPADHPLQVHSGCRCSKRPVFGEVKPLAADYKTPAEKRAIAERIDEEKQRRKEERGREYEQRRQAGLDRLIEQRRAAKRQRLGA